MTPSHDIRVYAPNPARSVRPPDLEPGRRDAARTATNDPRRRSTWQRIAELPVLILVALVLAFVIKTFLVQAFYIPSGSMTDTLAINDRVLVEKVTYRLQRPTRGQIVVFERPGLDPQRDGIGWFVRSFLEGLGVVPPDEDIDLIKRVVGLPGETIELHAGVVHVGGVPIAEPYARTDGRDFAPVEVPEDHYFMLGDNRANSDDSRYSLGMVPREEIVGRAFLILWPPSHATFTLGHDYPELSDDVLSSPVGAHGASLSVPERRTPHANARRPAP